MKNFTFGYARVSTEQQNLDRQLDALEKYGCDIIFNEKTDRSRLNLPNSQRDKYWGMRKITGKLRTIRSNTAIVVESMEFNPASKRTLAGILQGDRITHDNQRLLLEKLLIPVEGKE